ncbi:putative DNA-binding domain-containing protein [Methylovorus menthalis]|uniref:HvfC family RiPP maturation protein n=1 Tax=Methylovorus menthalis TaxID=1002227 RepID=UPI001E2C84F0|nr:putative DNA-binding domain-containing protein [Methylovorus menthalis]MCB4811390.1 putative DNA-binding domain-containing protein [Methylovorus menthalis]
MSGADTDLPLFQQYQLAFTAHIRHPRLHARPEGVPAKRMRVYNEIVFNNLQSAVGACYPVLQRVLGKRAWQALLRRFFAEHQANSPFFRDIPKAFLAFLPQVETLPPYAVSLAHYEWVELAIASADTVTPMLTAEGDLVQGIPIVAPALAVLAYDYPVQKISVRFKPRQALAEPVHLLVFRNQQDEVKFVEMNAMTARLLELLQPGELTGLAALQQLGMEMGHADSTSLITFGAALLEDLRQQDIVWGVAV